MRAMWIKTVRTTLIVRLVNNTTDVYREYGRAPPNQRAHASRSGVIGSREAYTVQLFTTLSDNPLVLYYVHNKADGPSGGELFVDFQSHYASYFLRPGDYYLVDNCKFHVQGCNM